MPGFIGDPVSLRQAVFNWEDRKMNRSWLNQLKFDPVSPLVNSGWSTSIYFSLRDLLDKPLDQLDIIRDDEVLTGIIKKQNLDGAWTYPKRKNPHLAENYNLLQTYRNLRILVETYGMGLEQAPVNQAVEYLLAHQSSDGDIRGIFGSQYAPHYTGGMLELIVKAGYGSDPRVLKTFEWFEETRQEDGGWAWVSLAICRVFKRFGLE
jgi:hypothetical protein